MSGFKLSAKLQASLRMCKSQETLWKALESFWIYRGILKIKFWPSVLIIRK